LLLSFASPSFPQLQPECPQPSAERFTPLEAPPIGWT